MLEQIVEINSDQRHLSVYRGFLVVKDTETKEEVGRVPLDDIAAVIGNAHGLSYSNNLLVELAKRGSPFVLCGSNHLPVGFLWSLDANYEQSRRIAAQINAKKPKSKQLWADLVRSKITQQSCVLEAFGINSTPLRYLIKQVKSGDSTNVEAQAARRYWELLFDKNFRRNQSQPGVNGLLNYGYTVLRAATARAVVAAGLHPSIGLHHHNASNALCLVDDLMEPFRPFIDYQVKVLHQEGHEEVDKLTKRELASVIYRDIETSDGLSPLMNSLHRLSVSLAQVFLEQRKGLELPKEMTMINYAAF